ncbi:MAG: acetoacetate decarboxylase family protein [Deltaproteobacteria bacterium]
MTCRNLLFLFITLILIAGCGGVRQDTKVKADETRTPAATAQFFEIKNSEQMLVIFTAPPAVVKNLAPAPLVASPYNLMVVYVSRTPTDKGFTQDMTLGVITGYKGRMYLYPVYRVVDNKEASEIGRMITGSPTRIARISLEKKDKTVTAAVEREGKFLFKATMALGEPGEPIDSSPVVNLKMVPGAQKDAPPELKQLVIGKIDPVKVHELIDGEVIMEFDQSLTDHFPKVSVTQIYRSVYRRADYRLTDMGVLYDYLKAD